MKLSQLYNDTPSNLLEYAGIDGHASIGTRANLQTTGLGSEGARQAGEIRGGDQLSLDRTPHDRALKGDVEQNIPGETGKRANTQKKKWPKSNTATNTSQSNRNQSSQMFINSSTR